MTWQGLSSNVLPSSLLPGHRALSSGGEPSVRGLCECPQVTYHRSRPFLPGAAHQGLKPRHAKAGVKPLVFQCQVSCLRDKKSGQEKAAWGASKRPLYPSSLSPSWSVM